MIVEKDVLVKVYIMWFKLQTTKFVTMAHVVSTIEYIYHILYGSS